MDEFTHPLPNSTAVYYIAENTRNVFIYRWNYVSANGLLLNNLIFNFIFTGCIHNTVVIQSGVRRDDTGIIIKLWSNSYTHCCLKHTGKLIHLLCVDGQCTKDASMHHCVIDTGVVITTHCSATGDDKSRQLSLFGDFIDRGQITHAP